jgi:hypothetical protein
MDELVNIFTVGIAAARIRSLIHNMEDIAGLDKGSLMTMDVAVELLKSNYKHVYNYIYSAVSFNAFFNAVKGCSSAENLTRNINIKGRWKNA